jgi:ATP-dependent exoDNAse (exonuclease V) alpha subunit
MQSEQRAIRIYKTYGVDAVEVLAENSYRLSRDVRGIGFKTADAIAMRLGIEKTAMIQLRADSFALDEATDLEQPREFAFTSRRIEIERTRACAMPKVR